jgi:hypothetical protein
MTLRTGGAGCGPKGLEGFGRLRVLAIEEIDALGTLITIAFEVALPPRPPALGKAAKAGKPPVPPEPPVLVAVVNPLPTLSAVLVAAAEAATGVRVKAHLLA